MKISLNKLGLYLTVISSTALVACGGSSSNPLDKYEGMKLTTPTNEKPEVQTYVQKDLFTMLVNGSKDTNTVNFIEGQSGSALINISSNLPSVSSFSVSISDFPNSERPTLSPTATKGVYAITWSAPVGTIPAGEVGKEFNATIQITVLSATDSLLVGTAAVKILGINVNRNAVQPTITSAPDLSKGVEEGQDTPFIVDVTIPSSGSGDLRDPELVITPYKNSNTEAYCANGQPYALLDETKENNPERIGSKYRFYYNMRIDSLPLDRDRVGQKMASAMTVPVCFNLRAISASGALSTQIQVLTKARYAAQPPTIQIVDSSGQVILADSQDIKAGSETVLNLKLSTEHSLSVVSILKPQTMISALSGKKEIVCTYDAADKKNQQTCIVKWTPACVSKTLTMALSVSAQSVLGTKVKTSALSKTLNVIPDLEACPIKPVVKGSK